MRKSLYRDEFVYLTLSHIISNRHVEMDMTDNFICKLYFKQHNDVNILKNGMDPFEIWNQLGYTAYGDSVVPVIVNRLIANNLKREFIVFDSTTRRVSLTDIGRQWAANYCSKRAGVI